ncbi:MAG: YncE family protein [Gemmatimonadales bacterium]
MRRPIRLSLTALVLATACADTTAPLPAPSEVLLAVNSTANTLSVVPLGAPNTAVAIPLGGIGATPTGVDARGGVAIVPLGFDNSAAIVNLTTGSVGNVHLPANSGATGVAIVSDSIAYVANPNRNSITRINYLTHDTASIAVGRYPQAIVFTRGKIFVLNGNLDTNYAPAGPSWLTVVDPVTNTVKDSIGLPGPGNAQFATVGADGLLYVMNSGSFSAGEGRLSIVDPVAQTELASFGGFGTGPGPVATSLNHLFVASYSEGLMEFDTDDRTVLKGAGNGIVIPSNAAVATDAEGRIYAISTGLCSGGSPGVAHVLRSDLTAAGTINLGECSVAALVTTIPPAP